jgi:anti-anti-sigma factor
MQKQAESTPAFEIEELEPLRPSVLRPDGELGVAELRALAQHCFRCAQEGQFQLLLDLAFVDHIDYRGVGMLIAARQLLKRQGGDLLLCGANPYLQAILRVAGAHGKLENCESVDAARARFFSGKRW